MKITFSDNKTFDMLAAYGRSQATNSLADLLAKTDREVIELHFNSAVVNMGELQPYYINPDDKVGVITITDDDNNSFVHKDYVIPLKFGMEYVGDDTNPHIIMAFAQLSETDKALREVSGKRKVYTGTDLEIAIAKKLDEVSAECSAMIENGVDVGENHFSLTDRDQINIGTWLNFANAGFAVPYHSDGNDCTVYTADEFKVIAYSAIRFVVHHTTYCNQLMQYIKSLTAVADVENVEYGQELTGEYLENYNNIMNNLPITNNG